MSTPLNIKVIVGSTRANRFSEKPSQWIFDLAKQRPDLDVELLDLRDYALPFFEEAFPPGYAKDNYDNPIVIKWREKIREADGFILVTPEYNHGYPAVLKNAMDWTFVEWRHKPITFVGWGNVGGARAIEQLRQVAVEFEMAPLRHAVHILPETMIAIRQAGDDADVSYFSPYEAKLELMIDDLLWWMQALTPARERDPAAH